MTYPRLIAYQWLPDNLSLSIMILTRMRLRVNRSKISGPALVAPQPDLLARAFSAALGGGHLARGRRPLRGERWEDHFKLCAEFSRPLHAPTAHRGIFGKCSAELKKHCSVGFWEAFAIFLTCSLLVATSTQQDAEHASRSPREQVHKASGGETGSCLRAMCLLIPPRPFLMHV